MGSRAGLLPPVGWNLKPAPAGALTRPVSTTFGKARAPRFSTSPQRRGARATVFSGKHAELCGVSTKPDDQWGSVGQVSRIAHPRHRGKLVDYDDWTTRPGYGLMPTYPPLVQRPPFNEHSRPQRSDASFDLWHVRPGAFFADMHPQPSWTDDAPRTITPHHRRTWHHARASDLPKKAAPPPPMLSPRSRLAQAAQTVEVRRSASLPTLKKEDRPAWRVPSATPWARGE